MKIEISKTYRNKLDVEKFLSAADKAMRIGLPADLIAAKFTYKPHEFEVKCGEKMYRFEPVETAAGIKTYRRSDVTHALVAIEMRDGYYYLTYDGQQTDVRAVCSDERHIDKFFALL